MRAEGMFNTWSRIVSDYSRREMSIPEDRLPALAGIVKYLQGFWEDDYIAGLWKSRFISQLAWKRHGKAPRQSAATYLAPTWSWASFPGAVVMQSGAKGNAVSPAAVFAQTKDHNYVVYELLEFAAFPTSPEAPFSQVKSGYAKIRGLAADLLAVKRVIPNIKITTDYESERDEDQISESVCLLLNSRSWDNVGIVIADAGDGAFKRIGHFESQTHGWGTEAMANVLPIECRELRVFTLV